MMKFQINKNKIPTSAFPYKYIAYNANIYTYFEINSDCKKTIINVSFTWNHV